MRYVIKKKDIESKNVRLSRVRVTIVAVDEKKVVLILNVCL